MNERTVEPVSDASSVGAVRSSAPSERPAWLPANEAHLPDLSLPGVSEFDQLELTTGATLRQSYAKFTIDRETGITCIKIIDSRTDRVIREIPPEQVLKIVQELQNYLAARQQRGG
jgi:hypothetical protein